jgi:copper(I)-binding protein
LQILLPGETAAPNTPSGKTGTPLAQSANVPFDVIVNSVDANWNVVSGSTDQIAFTSTSGDFYMVSDPEQPSLSGGTVTATVEFISGGSATITANDATDGSKTANTSPTITF